MRKGKSKSTNPFGADNDEDDEQQQQQKEHEEENFFDCEQHHPEPTNRINPSNNDELQFGGDNNKLGDRPASAARKIRFENPFDDDDGRSNQPQPPSNNTQRKAKLNFDLGTSLFDDLLDEQQQHQKPALDFTNANASSSNNGNEFFSPLENAMIQQRIASPTARQKQGFASSSSFVSDHEAEEEEADHDHDDDGDGNDVMALVEKSPLLQHLRATTTASGNFRRQSSSAAGETGGLLAGSPPQTPHTPQRSVVSDLSATSSPYSNSSSPNQKASSIPKEILAGFDGSLPKLTSGSKKKSRGGGGSKRSISSQKRNKQRLTKKAASHASNTKSKRILKSLVTGESEFIMDYKYILLEDLGTASSWLILLLPYISFFVSLLIESSKSIQVATVGPLYYANLTTTTSQQQTIATATRYAFESDIIHSIPVISTYMYGDATFHGLSEDAVSFVEHGKLEASVELLQRDTAADVTDDAHGYNQTQSYPWTVMFSSAPRRVTMICSQTNNKDRQNNTPSSSVCNCKSPRLVDILFSMPDTAVYAGGDIRINIYYNLRQQTNVTQKYHLRSTNNVKTSNKVNSSSISILSVGNNNNHSSPSTTAILEEILSSSSITLEHMSHFAQVLDTSVRIATFLISFLFIIYWCQCMGIWKRLYSYCCCCCCCQKKEPKTTLWWESPWILFPERYYILVLLLFLLLMQEPLLAAMFFFPQRLGSSTRLHLAADATIGIGVHGVLFVYLCLFDGLKFHTAEVSRKRTEHQRKSLELRKAAAYVNAGQQSTEERISQYTDTYYDQFGDIDGSASTGHLILQNDPFGDGWADFLLFKVLLLLIGISSVTVTAYCRFPPDDGSNFSNLNIDLLDRYKTGYIISITLQFAIELVWMYLILEAAFVTGRVLRHEPFLSTRPAQLSYRILFAHTTLGFLALGVSFALSLSHLFSKWSLQPPSDGGSSALKITGGEDLSHLEIMIQLISQVAQQFPYSGTAASVGSGRILFATVSILITAFIFLPAHALEENDGDEDDDTNGHNILKEQRRLRRDKRLVVHLARESKTWRVFPVPIEPSFLEKAMLQDRGYQLYKNMHIEYGNTRERGVVSVGPYTPVFCVELACWLNEACWQAYYSPGGLLEESAASIKGMNLDSIGLRLEGVVYDTATDSQAYIATNSAPQVDGDEDSLIVISFRGTASQSNVQTDLRSNQVPLLDQVTGIGSAPFCIFPDRFEIYDSDGWIWDTPVRDASDEEVKCATTWTSGVAGCMPSHCAMKAPSRFVTVSNGARAILQATPVAQTTLPRVHQGFQKVYSAMRKKVLDILFPVLQRQLAKSLRKSNDCDSQQEPLSLPKIYITGHSLGGSLAQLLALDLAGNCEIVLPILSDNAPAMRTMNLSEEEIFNLPSPGSYQKSEHGELPFTTADPSDNKNSHLHNHQTKTTASRELRLQPPVAVYTFGQPRVGNKAFTRLYKQKVPHTFRVVNEGDVITTVPNVVFGGCGGVYKHSGLAVLLDEGCTGNILVGPTIVETVFRFHQVTADVQAHSLNRYRDCLESALAQDELVEYYKGHNGVGKDVGTNSSKDVDIPQWMTNYRSS